MLKRKNAIGPVVAVALLIVVSVVTVIGFQNWFSSYSSDMFVKTEKKSQGTSNTNIETLVGDQLYFKNTLNENVSIKQIKIGNRECNISITIEPGVHNISLGNCVDNLTLDSNIGDIAVITENQIYSKKHLFKDVSIVPSVSSVVESGNYFTYLISGSVEGFEINGSFSNTIYNNSLNSIVLSENTNFMFTLNGSQNDFAREIINTFDGGYIISGSSKSYGGTDNDFLLIKFNSEGIKQWSKLINLSDEDIIWDIVETFDQGYVITGTTLSYGGTDEDIFLIKFNSVGIEQWSKIIDGSASDVAFSLIEMNDNSLILTGYTTSWDGSDQDIFLSKFNSDGVEQWSKTLGGSSNDAAYSVVETSDNGLVLGAETTSYGSGDRDIFLSKFNSNGVEQWSKTIVGSGTDFIYDLLETSSGDLFAVGYVQAFADQGVDIFLSKFDNDGIEQWTKIISGSGTDQAFKIIETNDNNFLVLSRTTSYGGDYDILLTKFDNNGIEIWSKLIGGTSEETGFSLIENNQGNLILSGLSSSYGGTDYDVFILKLDENGNLDSFEDIVDLDIVEIDKDISEIDETITEVDQIITETDISLSEIDINISFDKNYPLSEKQYFSQGLFTSQVFNRSSNVNWTGISYDGINLNLNNSKIWMNENCNDISSWVNVDSGTGVSSQTTFDGQEVFKFAGGASTLKPNIYKDGENISNEYTFEIKVYVDSIGVYGSTNYFRVYVDNDDVQFIIRFNSDGLYLYHGLGWYETGIDLVQLDTWQEWKFIVNTSNSGSEVVDVYRKDGGVWSLKASNQDISYDWGTNGRVGIVLDGNSGANALVYVDYLKVYNSDELDFVNIQTRSCNDPLCSGESWINQGSNNEYTFNENNQYFQYQLNLTTNDLNRTPEVSRVNITYQE